MENQRQKLVNLCYIVGSFLLAYIVLELSTRFSAIYDLEARVTNLEAILRVVSIASGLGLFIYLIKSDRVNQYMNEVVAELSRVTWPTPEDTKNATIVVIIMVIISGMMLGFLDFVWSEVFKAIL